MKKKYRLLEPLDFQILLKHGNKIFTSNFVCYWKSDFKFPNIRIGIIIPKKKCKLACKRKKYKRIFWAINNLDFSSLPKIKCLFFYRNLFFEKYEKKEVSFDSLRKEYAGIMNDLKKRNNCSQFKNG